MIWQNLKSTDVSALISLQQACYAADGHFAIPIEWDFEQALADSVASQYIIHDDKMIAAAWLRESGGLLHLRMLARLIS